MSSLGGHQRVYRRLSAIWHVMMMWGQIISDDILAQSSGCSGGQSHCLIQPIFDDTKDMARVVKHPLVDTKLVSKYSMYHPEETSLHPLLPKQT